MEIEDKDAYIFLEKLDDFILDLSYLYRKCKMWQDFELKLPKEAIDKIIEVHSRSYKDPTQAITVINGITNLKLWNGCRIKLIEDNTKRY